MQQSFEREVLTVLKCVNIKKQTCVHIFMFNDVKFLSWQMLFSPSSVIHVQWLMSKIFSFSKFLIPFGTWRKRRVLLTRVRLEKYKIKWMITWVQNTIQPCDLEKFQGYLLIFYNMLFKPLTSFSHWLW